MSGNISCARPAQKGHVSIKGRISITKADPNKKYNEMRMAIDRNDLEAVIKHSYGVDIGDENIFDDAIMMGNLEIIKRLYIRRCPRYSDDYCIRRAITRNHPDVLTFFLAEEFQLSLENIYLAGSTGKVELLRIIKKFNAPFNNKLFCEVSQSGNEECIRYLVEVACPYGSDAFYNICQMNNLDLLRLVFERCIRVENINRLANEIYGVVKNIEVFKYLHKVVELPWNETTLGHCLWHEKIDIIEYLIDNDCHMDIETSDGAIDNGSVEVVKFLHENKCPFDHEVSVDDIGNEEVATYYHDYIYSKELCEYDCWHCCQARTRALWDSWELIDNEYQSFNQWFPREIMEDVVSLCEQYEVNSNDECSSDID